MLICSFVLWNGSPAVGELFTVAHYTLKRRFFTKIIFRYGVRLVSDGACARVVSIFKMLNQMPIKMYIKYGYCKDTPYTFCAELYSHV